MRNRWAALLVGGVMASFTLGVQGTASAATNEAATTLGWPTGCTYGDNGANGAQARCTNSNGGHYKATATCQPYSGGPAIYIDAKRWSSGGEWSNAYCPPLTAFIDAGILSKAS